MVAVVVHQIYVGTDGDKQQPFFLSIVLTDSNNQGAPQYKAILWKKTVNTHPPTHATQYTQRKILIFFFLFLNTKKGAQKIYLPHTPGRPLTVKQILRYKTSLFFSFQTCLFDIGFNFLFLYPVPTTTTKKKKKSNFHHMDRLEKAPKEVVSPELQKVLSLFFALMCIDRSIEMFFF